MKRAIQFLFPLALFFFHLDVFAQEQPSSQKFPIGSFIGDGHDTDPQLYNSFIAAGMNTIAQYADENTKPFMTNLDVIALNQNNAQDYIFYYATSYYSKWNAEQNQLDLDKVGVKHKYGQMTTWITGQDTVLCWSSLGLTSPADSLVYGPHYHQEKRYKRWYYDSYANLSYTPRYRMALQYDPELVNPNEEVCKLTIRVRHAKLVNGDWTGEVPDDTLKGPYTLKVSDFPSDGSFKYFYLDDDTLWYQYPEEFWTSSSKGNYETPLPGQTITYNDMGPMNGIEFLVDWLRDDNLCTLYMDEIEVYDNDGWNKYVDDPSAVSDTIQSYTQNYSDWSNLKYWYSHDEPYSQDAYLPMHIVDSLVQNAGGSPLITYFYPYWGITVNGDSQLVKYYNSVKPEKLMIDYYPMSETYDVVRWEDLESTREQFQIAHSLQPGFWYVGQGFGFRLPDDSWCIWRKPEPSELSATIMLALAHGSKGILFWNYDSYSSSSDYCGPYYVDCIVDDQLNPTALFYLIKNNLAPRLNGTLGSTLLSIDYTSDYLPLKRFNSPNYLPPAHYDYLTMQFNGNGDCNFHTGFLENSNQPDNKYFLTANILTTSANTVNISVTKSNENFINYRFRNVESQFDYDTTFNTSLNIDYTFPAGEGYLFQVTPVVLYGGRLRYNETVNNISLYDDLVIENGATLTVTGTYSSNANITVKDGGSIKTVDGGEIIFSSGKRLIIDGLATVKGTAANKLTLDFLSPGDGNGFFVKANADFTLSNCIVKNSETGVNVLPNSIPPSVENININNTSFVDCIKGITVTGSVVVDLKIKQCSITNAQTGISLTNLNKGTIQSNFISNSECGIILNQSSNINVVGNSISSSQNELPGIEMISSGGTIRANTISGHSTGIVLGNSSSTKIGGNTITGNLINGIYVGANSNPDLRAMLGGNPPNLYPISGHNEIFNNGGYNALGTNEDDGSEIYLSTTGKIKLADGCNQIMDDRLPDFAFLDTTFTLMNGDATTQVKADTNSWGTTNGGDPAGRFGILNVQYLPYLTEPCIIPQGGGLMMITQTASGEAIDTVYSTGEVVSDVEQIDLLYSQADELYLTAKFSEAIVLYNQIITDYPDDSRSIYAYIELYKINKTQNADSTVLNDLREFYNERLTQITDTTLIRTINHLSNLCLVGVEKYNEAINEFDEIVQNNPNTDEAFFAEIDALTTSYLLSLSGQTLGKTANTNYLVKSSSDYHSMLNDKMKQKFGKPTVPEEEKIIPEQYFLYQNYPNPFNPTTSIKFDLPKAGNVELTVYDILGRRVKQLLNETKPAGTYEITFNASKLASGVYIYTIKSNDFTASKKLMLLK
ncbi:MAG: T9SS type A sorting domain-containing protein [Ignavibacteriales bacterium]|nr:T9SS type A sorting domain-containing protein [Ignavibacteriales bacterium]